MDITEENKSAQPVAAAQSSEREAVWTSVLRKYWGYGTFRSIQLDIIRSIADGHDTLGLMPTGGGKSLTFQVPAMAMEGMCLVVTPLIALMKDQVENLRKRGIMAAAVYSGQPRSEVLRHLDNAVFGAYKFLYVSPERLSTSIFLNKVQRMHVSIITVDEAHCISQWGYDFRPHYLRIAEVRRLVPDAPVLALTATATPEVVDDIQDKLAFRQGAQVFRMSFARDNLHYYVRFADDKTAELIHIIRSVPGSAIVYTRSRRGTREVAEILHSEGITAHYYHAGLSSLDKDVRQQAWQTGRVRVMVATNAFGMGIDKSDVRLVVHADVPDSPEAYFQEAGRGGRDGKVAYAVLLYNNADARKLRARVPQTFPDREYIRKVYGDLANFFQIAEGEAEGRTFDFDMARFSRVFKHYPVVLVSALNLLTQAGYIHFAIEDENSSRVMFLVRRDELYNVDYLDADEERLLNALMRSNGGFFTDYVTVEENRLGEACGLTAQQVYEKLRHITQLRVINYIPHKDTPQITYTQRRIDAGYVQIMPEIYERRRDQYVRRLEAMIEYFTQDTVCRSRYLLRYFADEGEDCRHCDVCNAREGRDKKRPADNQVEAARRYILDTLSAARKPVEISALKQTEHPREALQEALEQLVGEEEIVLKGLFVSLKSDV